jgi:hypothetical protein
VQPDTPPDAAAKTFKREEAHTILSRTNGVPIAPFPKEKEKPAKPTTPTPAPTAPATTARKAIEGMTATYAPTDDLFFCEDAGYPLATVLQAMKRVIALAQARSISVDDYLTALEEE